MALGYDVTKDPSGPANSATVKPASGGYKAPTYYTPVGSGVAMSDINAYQADTIRGIADIVAAYSAAGSGSSAGAAAARKAQNDRLKFGLRGIELNRQQLQLDTRDALEQAVNNALQRGIYQSGIRIRNEARAQERSDLGAARIDLSEDELRASVKNALASISAQAKAAASAASAQAQMARAQWEMQRRQALDQWIINNGGVFDDSSIRVVTPQPQEGLPY